MCDRHFPRLCRSSEAPMARQEDTSWRCGATWVSRDRTRSQLRVIPGGAASHRDDARAPAPQPSAARAATKAHLNADRR
jgi:hypothetical protein